MPKVAKSQDTYYVRVKEGFEEVEGKPVIIKGLEDFDFFIHRPLDQEEGWQITEARTGLSVCGQGATQKDTIAHVVQKLRSCTEDAFQAFVDGNNTIWGVSPRYEAEVFVPLELLI